MALEKFESDMETCTRCSACKFVPLETISSYDHVNVCPSIARYDFNAYSGGGRLAFGLGLLRERVDYTPKVAEIIYNCHLCGGCDVSCKYGMDMEVLEPLYAMRRECVERGLTQPALDKMVSSMRKHGPLLQGAGGTRGQWLKGLGVKDCREEKVKVVYHAGCLASMTRPAERLLVRLWPCLRRPGSTSVRLQTSSVAGAVPMAWATKMTP